MIIDRTVHGRAVRVEASAHLDLTVEELFAALETIPADDLRAGTSFRMGWTVYELVDGEGVLRVVAPELSSDPGSRRSADLTLPLWVHLEQRHLLRRINVRGDFPLYSDKVVYHEGALEAADVVLSRQEASPQGDSGWFLGIVGRDAEPHELKAVWMWELLRRRRSLLQAVALPGGWLAGFEGDSLDAVIDPSGAVVWRADDVPDAPDAPVDSDGGLDAPVVALAALLHRDAAGIRAKRLDELTAWYAWSTERGGDAVILADDGSWLRAPSAVPPERHRADFASGRRTQSD
jgi:hypothetical protein